MAAIDFLAFPRSSPQGVEACNMSTNLRALLNQIGDQKARLDHMTDGLADSGTNYVNIESLYGLAAGKGKSFYDLVTLLNTQINASAAVEQMAFKLQLVA